MRPNDGSTGEAIARVFSDPSAVWTLDEVAGRFGMSLGEAIRVMSDLEAIDVVRRIGDEYVPGMGAATAS
jgi:DNA-binding IclR family transcriptional regulator